MELTSRQKKALRATGRTLAVRVQVGRAGLTEGLLDTIRSHLRQASLLKVRLPAAGQQERRRMAAALADAVAALCVDVVGRNVVLYRPGADDPEESDSQRPGQTPNT